MELEHHYNDIVWEIVWELNKVIDIGEWSVCESGQLERFLLFTVKQIFTVYSKTSVTNHFHTAYSYIYLSSHLLCMAMYTAKPL